MDQRELASGQQVWWAFSAHSKKPRTLVPAVVRKVTPERILIEVERGGALIRRYVERTQVFERPELN